MKKIALILLLVYPESVLAEGMTHIPPWTMVGGRACYEFDQAKRLVELDSELETFLLKEAIWTNLTKNLKESVSQLSVALEAEKHASDTLRANGQQLTARLMTETERANTAEARPGPFPAWLYGAGIGAIVGAIAGVLLGIYAAHR